MRLRLVERLIGHLKRDANYHFAVALQFSDLLTVMSYRGMQILRGIPLRIRVRQASGLLFVGGRVIIRHRSHIWFGRHNVVEDGVRIDALSSNGVRFGDNVTVKSGAVLVCSPVIRHLGVGISIGNNSSIGAMSYLDGQGGISIGNDVLIGPGVKIFSADHIYESESVLIREQGDRRKPVVIEDNCWIGAGSILLKGSIVRSGSVVGAGAVVTTEIPPNSLAVGSPAKVMHSRRR